MGPFPRFPKPTVFSPRSCRNARAEWEGEVVDLPELLTPKLPASAEEDLSKGILEAIDMDSYRVEKLAVMKIQLPDANAEIGPVPTSGGGEEPEQELDRRLKLGRTFSKALVSRRA